MATPRAAQHRDLEQRLRDLERGLRFLTGSALRRDQYAVTFGDFKVSGGGGIIVADGGSLRADYPDAFGGHTAVSVGPWGTVEDPSGYQLAVYGESPGVGPVFIAEVAHPSRGLGALARQVRTDAASLVSLVASIQAELTGPNGQFVITNGVTQLRGGNLQIVSDRPGNPILLSGATTQVQDGLQVYGNTFLYNAPNVSGSANVSINPSGRLQRATSSRRYKQDIADAEVDTAAVLAGLRGRTWRDRAEVAADPDTTYRHVGYIAEEVHDAGLGAYVTYDEDGPEAVSYDRLTVPLLAVAKEQQTRLDEQAVLIRDLTARVEALEAAGSTS